MSDRICENCGGPITGKGDRFCGPDCYNGWRADQREKRKDAHPICAADGCSERVTKPGHNKFCSPECGYTSPARKPDGVKPDASLSAESYQVVSGTILFTVRGKIVQMPLERFDGICRDYSDYGGGMTLAQVARKHGIPQPTMRRMLSAYGQYHASPPMTRERIEAAEDLDPLVAEAIEAKEYRLIQRIERAQRQAIEREHRDMLRELKDEERHTEAAKEIVEGLTVVVGDRPRSVRDTVAATGRVAHVPTTDEHIGMYNWSPESFGENLTADISAAALRTHADLAVGWLEARGGVETVYRTFLGDLLHGTETEHGTKLDIDTREARVWSIALAATIESIGALLDAAENVRVVMVAGNHDAHDTAKLRESVRLAFAGEDRVTVDPSPMRYAAFRVGESLHVLDHGYGVRNLTGWKAQAQAEVLAREVGLEDYVGAKHVYTYVGHLHQRQVATLGAHHELIRLPAFTEADEYSTKLRYPGRPAARAYLLDDRGRHVEERAWYADALHDAGVDTR